MARRIQNQRHGNDPLGLLGGAFQALRHQYVGKLDEADLNIQFRVLLTPVVSEILDLLVAVGVP